MNARTVVGEPIRPAIHGGMFRGWGHRRLGRGCLGRARCLTKSFLSVQVITILSLNLWNGCGPIRYYGVVNQRAADRVAEAKAENTVKYAPYEYWSALTYLHMAREKAARADFEISLKYGERSIRHAHKAFTLQAVRLKEIERKKAQDLARKTRHIPATSGQVEAGTRGDR